MKSSLENAQLKRPPLITVICTLGMIGFAATVPVIFGLIDSLGTNRLYLAISAIVGFTSFIGLWYMQKWGLYLYFAMLLLNQAMMIFVFKSWNEASLFVPAIVVLAGIIYYDRMT